MKKTFISTFNQKLFEQYAHRLIETYIDTKQLIPMIIYVEDELEFYPKVKNITYLSLFDVEPECQSFVTRNRHREVTSYLNDAVRFCYKVFAQAHSHSLAEKVYYVDSDCVFIEQIPLAWFDECLPDNVFTSFYHREDLYTETGFIAFNNRLSCAKLFFDTYKNHYIQDTIYRETTEKSKSHDGLTDCHAFDRTREALSNNLDYVEKYLGDQSIGHPMATDYFINDYLDHRKGARKAFERSPEWDETKSQRSNRK